MALVSPEIVVVLLRTCSTNAGIFRLELKNRQEKRIFGGLCVAAYLDLILATTRLVNIVKTKVLRPVESESFHLGRRRDALLLSRILDHVKGQDLRLIELPNFRLSTTSIKASCISMLAEKHTEPVT